MLRQLGLVGCAVAVIVVALQADALAAPAGSVCDNRKPPPVDTTHSRSWCHVDARAGKVRVWWEKDSAPGERVATVALAAVDGGAWQRLISYFGKEPLRDDLDDRSNRPRPQGDFGGSGALDVTVDSLPPEPQGDEVGRWEGTRSHSCYSPRNGHVLLEKNPPLAGAALKRRIKLTVAHELAHAIFAAFPVNNGRGCSQGYDWLNEATATWASGFAYESALLDDQWSYLLLDQPSTRLNAPAPALPIYPQAMRVNRFYAGSLLFLFFERIYGQPLAKEAWVHANTMSGIDAVDRALVGAGRRGLPAVWPGFAQWLWNKPPVDQLSRLRSGIRRGAITVGTKPTGSTAKPPTNKPVELTLPRNKVANVERLKVKLEPLSVQYHKLTQRDPRIRTITYRGPTLTPPERPFFVTSALTGAPGRPPRLEEWALERPHMFCLTDHPVRDLVLMFSLGDPASGGPSTGEAQVWTSNSCAAPRRMAWESPEAGGSVIGGGKDLQLSVELDRPAAAGGVEVALAEGGTGVPNGAVTVPAKVVVPAGKQKVTFNVGTAPVDDTVHAVIRASRGKELAIPGEASAGLRLIPPGPARVVLPLRINEQEEFSGTVILDGAAGPKGMKVKLHAWGPAPIAKLPDSITVPAGSKQAKFKGKAGKLNCPQSCESSSSVRAIAHGQDSIGWTTIVK
jgi:hypothetical protein